MRGGWLPLMQFRASSQPHIMQLCSLFTSPESSTGVGVGAGATIEVRAEGRETRGWKILEEGCFHDLVAAIYADTLRISVTVPRGNRYKV